MPSEIAIPMHIQSLLDRADLSLLRGKHGEASTLFWKATEAAITAGGISPRPQARLLRIRRCGAVHRLS